MAAPGIPQWLIPPQTSPGQLSNKRASNTGADRVVAQYRVKPGSAAFSPGSMRVLGTRPVVGGVAQPQPNNTWDSAWTGHFATSPFPSIYSGITLGANSATVAGSRVYVLVPSNLPYGNQSNIIASVVSAPINGPNIGSWRFEAPIQVQKPDLLGVGQVITDSCNPGAMVHISGWLFVLGQKGIYRASIDLEGKVSSWSWLTDTLSGVGSTMCGWGRYNNGGILVVAYNNAPAQPANTIYVNSFSFAADGSFAGNASLTTIGATGQRPYGALVIDPNSWLYYIGGEDNSGNPQSTVYYKAVNLGTGIEVASTGWVVGQALPAARSRFGCAFVNWPSANWPGSTTSEVAIQVAGGRTTSGGVGQTTVYATTGTGIRAPAAWGSFTSAMPVAGLGCAATSTSQTSVVPGGTAAVNFSPTTNLGYENAVDVNAPWSYLVVIGGNTTDVQVSSEGGGGTGPSGTGPWYRGAGSTLVNADLGTGGLVTPNSDGSYDITFPIGGKGVSGFGAAMGTTTLLDGDQLQLVAQVADAATGDVATSPATLIKIGQAPTVTSLAASSTTSGRPIISFRYNQGVGGSGEYNWRVTVIRNSDSVVMFDSGLLQGTDNSIQVLTAPMLASGIAYNVSAVVTSVDDPLAGSSDTFTSTFSLTPSLSAAPGVPSSVSATPVTASGWIQLNWTNAAATTENRIYYRRTGSGGAMQLLVKDLLLGVGAQSVKLMDKLAYGVSYDFAVSAIAANSESALSSTVAATLTPPVDSPWAFLHLAGQPLTGAAGVAVQMLAWPKMSVVNASATIARWSSARPLGRQGIINYRVLELDFLSVHSTNLGALETLIDAALAGGMLYYRDRRGTMFPAILNTPSGIGRGNSLSLGGGDVQFLYPDHTSLTMRLIQVDDVYSPYVPYGTAIGVPTLASGTIPPLNRIELVA